MWSHKYRDLPLDTHVQRLCTLVGHQNTVVYGPHGNGMMSVVQRTLHQLELMPREHEWSFVECRLSTDNKNMLNILSRRNTRCTELVLREFGTNERYVVKNILQKLSESYVISENNTIAHKLIVIYNIEFLSKESQNIIGVFLEKHVACSRYLFTSNNMSGVHRSLKTHCTMYRLPRLSVESLRTHLEFIAMKENVQQEVDYVAIIDQNDAHADHCIDRFQMKVLGVESSFDQQLNRLYEIVWSKKLNKLKLIREILYTLLVNNVDPKRIIHATLIRFRQGPGLVYWAAEYEHRLVRCERPMYHLEAFFVRVLLITRTSVNSKDSSL